MCRRALGIGGEIGSSTQEKVMEKIGITSHCTVQVPVRVPLPGTRESRLWLKTRSD